MTKYLKLIAKTDEDLKVISAHLQDSIVSLNDIANLKKNKIFLMQVNRFMWEDVEKGVLRKNKRIRSIIKFDQHNLYLYEFLIHRKPPFFYSPL